jgi:hypothetical protein
LGKEGGMQVTIEGVRAFDDVIGKGFGIHIGWFDGDGGWGHIEITQEVIADEPTMVIDSEYMSRAFVKQVLCEFVDSANLKHEQEGK